LKTIKVFGYTGFIGKNLTKYLKSDFNIIKYIKYSEFNIQEDIVINLVGIAHDIKNGNNPEEYYNINTFFSNSLFDSFLISNAKVFITISSTKAVADNITTELTENIIPNPITDYGKSKLLAENYILSKQMPSGKRFFILRPCMIHGPGNKGNLNLLYNIISKGLPWPLGAFDNKRSFCSIDNLCFVINELIKNDEIPSGVYNIADDEPLSTSEIVSLIAEIQGKISFILYIPQTIIKLLSRLGDILNLPLNTERLKKLTETYIVSNNKILQAINKPLPISSKEGLIKTLISFETNKAN
jgi:nucleoside-diphosphate-sugar epimerase